MPEQGTLQLENVSLSYDSGLAVLESIDLTVRQGECISIEGMSGSGKTTLLLAIMQIYPLQTGSIYYEVTLIDQVDLSSFINALLLTNTRLCLWGPFATIFY